MHPVSSHRSRLPALALVVAALAGATGCGGSQSAPTPLVSTTPQALPPPDIAAFLRQPVATPTTCASGQHGSASGLGSPWVGHVDISVFIAGSASKQEAARLGNSIRQAKHVTKVYFESSTEAYQEFQRLYTCWAQVKPSQTPASYRIVLDPTTRIDARNALVARLTRLPGVDSVSCDPALPCVNIVRSASPHA